MNKHLKPFLFFASLFLLLFPVTASAQEYNYTELGERFPRQCIWTTFDEEFDLLIPYLFTEQEITEEDMKDGIIYKSSFADDGEDACHMTIIKDEFEEPVSEQELCEFLPTLRMDVSPAKVNDISVLFVSRDSEEPLYAMLYIKENVVYSILINILDNSARDIEILFYSLFPTAEDTHRTMIPDMDLTLAKLAKNFCM